MGFIAGNIINGCAFFSVARARWGDHHLCGRRKGDTRGMALIFNVAFWRRMEEYSFPHKTRYCNVFFLLVWKGYYIIFRHTDTSFSEHHIPVTFCSWDDTSPIKTDLNWASQTVGPGRKVIWRIQDVVRFAHWTSGVQFQGCSLVIPHISYS